MKLEEYRILFAVATLSLILFVTVPVIAMVMPFPRNESFSELWLLGPTHMAEGYPFNVNIGEKYSIFVGGANHMGNSKYYLVYVKFCNPTQPLPSVPGSKPSPLPQLYEFQLFVEDGETWESLLTFEILDAYAQNDRMFVESISINDLAFSVNSFSKWDSENNGFYYHLFFELWHYDISTKSFQYHDRFVGIWINMTNYT